MCDFVEKEKIGLIIKRGIRVKLTIRVRLKLGQTFASGLTLINKRFTKLPPYLYFTPFFFNKIGIIHIILMSILH